jgi:hypothetical protein
MSNKLETLTLDELLELMEEAGDSIESLVDSTERSVKKFIKEHNITPGQTKVPSYVIFYHYRRVWRLQGNKVNKIVFFRNFNKLFDQYRTKSTRYYLLNEGIFDLSQEDLNEAKESDKRYEKKIKKKPKKSK